MGRLHQENGGVSGAQLIGVSSAAANASVYAPFADTSTIKGGSIAVTGSVSAVNGGLRFTGSNYVTTTFPSFNAQGTWTLDFFYRTTGPLGSDGYNCQGTFGTSTGPVEMSFFTLNGDIGVFNNYGWGHQRSGVNVANGAWRHVMLSSSNGVGTLYVDGVARINNLSMPALTFDRFYWGQWMSTLGSYAANGEIKDVRLTLGQALVVVPTYTSLLGGNASGMSGGSVWFSPGYFGVEPLAEYLLAQGTYTSVRYRRTQEASYSWWALFCTRSSNTYTVTFGARIITPAGTVGEVLDLPLSQAAQIVGSPVVSGISTYLCWLSHAPGESPGGPTNIHYFDSQHSNYVQTSTVPAVGVSYTPTTLESGGRPRFQAIGAVDKIFSGVFQVGPQKLLYQP